MPLSVLSPASRPQPRVVSPWLWAGVILATVLAAALRFPFLAHQSLWFDEIYTRAIVARHSLAGIWDQVRATESTPPLYYLVAKLSTDLAGTSTAAALRAPSALALTAAVPVSFLAFRRLIGERPALAVAAFVAVNPLLVSFATDARSYGLLVLTALLSVWGFAAALQTGRPLAYLGWAAAAVACLWTHYFGVFTVGAEAVILLAIRPDQRGQTLLWMLLIAACAAPLIPLIVHQNSSQDAAYIAGISLASRLEQTVRQTAMGANVPRTWLEAGGLLVLGVATAAGLAAALVRPGARLVLLLAAITAGVPLALAVLGIEDRFYLRNLIVITPLVGALAAPILLRLRGAPLVLYLVLATVTSLWVATNWRYEQVDWRTAAVRARALDAGVPVLVVGLDSEHVAAAYLQRSPTNAAVHTARALLIVQPYRGPGDRGLVPAPVPPAATAALRGFTASPAVVVKGFALILLRASRPLTLSSDGVPAETLFPRLG